MSKSLKAQSKFLSLVLRHNPEKIGITLDKNGWVKVVDLLNAANSHGQHINQSRLIEIVETNDKKRFSFSDDGLRIRANQGHSIKHIDLGLESSSPPDVLYHGTVDRFMVEIREDGLKKMSRQHVHLSADEKTAIKVGQRRGKPIVLSVDAKKMADAGYVFYLSENGVWLTDHVPWTFIRDENT